MGISLVLVKGFGNLCLKVLCRSILHVALCSNANSLEQRSSWMLSYVVFLVQVDGVGLCSPACACPGEVEEHHWAHSAGEVWDDGDWDGAF